MLHRRIETLYISTVDILCRFISLKCSIGEHSIDAFYMDIDFRHGLQTPGSEMSKIS